MTWAKFDDRYHDNPKVNTAWSLEPSAVGFHAMSITYCAMHETDGLIPALWISQKLPHKGRRVKVLDALVMTGLFEDVGDGRYVVHDYLEYNPSKVQAEQKREAKKAAGKKGADARWHPEGNSKSHSNSNGTCHDEAMADRNAPDPARP